MKINQQSIGWYGKSMSIFILLFYCNMILFAQEAKQTMNKQDGSENISPALLKQDFLYFKQSLENNHPGLYRYKSKKQIDNLFDSCLAALGNAMPVLAFGKTIAFLISSIEDGHTASNVPRLLMNEYAENEPLFPLHIYFVGQKAFVYCSNNKAFLPGTELLSIDNKPITEIKNMLLQYLPSDGRIETKKLHTLNNGAFALLYRWVFGGKGVFTVGYKTRNGLAKKANIGAALAKELNCDVSNGPYNKKDIQFDFLQNQTALLTIKTFDDNRIGDHQKFSAFLNSTFKEINARNIRTLIIDLRGNSGGRDDYGSLLYSFIAKKPFKYFLSVATVKGNIALKDNSLLTLQEPNENSYKGTVLFLINGLSFSTTADFCAIAKTNKRGLFIGEETGGAYDGNTSGQIKNITLPASNIIIKIPLFKYVNDVRVAKHKNRGIIPDYRIIPTIDDVILKKDVQLSFAYTLTKQKR